MVENWTDECTSGQLIIRREFCFPGFTEMSDEIQSWDPWWDFYLGISAVGFDNGGSIRSVCVYVLEFNGIINRWRSSAR